MKIVKERINEAFSEHSDPIEDMGIGLGYEIDRWLKTEMIEPDVKINTKFLIASKADKLEYLPYLISKGANVHHQNELALVNKAYDFINTNYPEVKKKALKSFKYLLSLGADLNKALELNQGVLPRSIQGLLEIKEILDNEKLQEAFKEHSDPVQDLGIGSLHAGKYVVKHKFGVSHTGSITDVAFNQFVKGQKIEVTNFYIYEDARERAMLFVDKLSMNFLKTGKRFGATLKSPGINVLAILTYDKFNELLEPYGV